MSALHAHEMLHAFGQTAQIQLVDTLGVTE